MFRIIVEKFDEQKGFEEIYKQTVDTLSLIALMALVNKKKRIRAKKEKEN